VNAAPSTCLITGAEGLVGTWLAEHLLSQGHRVRAGVLGSSAFLKRLTGPLEIRLLDVRDPEAVAACVREVQPDRVFHLAAQSLPRLSWQRPALTLEVNVLGTLHLLDACRDHAPAATVVAIGSSSEYASDPEGRPIPETAPQSPASPYGISKWCSDECARLYAERYGLRIVRVRPFFLVGPRKTGDVCSDFARGVVAIERGQAPCLSVGDLDVVRDFLDVRDAVRALDLLAVRGEAGEVYNLCRGRGRRVREVLDGYARLASVPIESRLDPSLIRPQEDRIKVGDPTRLLALGWAPAVPWEQTLADILDYWRKQE
jgi:GDP-4-dehydro-6-deoxy-D-mannose reductase